MKGNNKSFYKHISDKRKMREDVSLLMNEMGDLVTQDSEKVMVLNSFTSFLTLSNGLQELQVPETRVKGGSKEDVCTLDGRRSD